MSSWTVPGYTEERELGRGASGRVVVATSQKTERRVAIKYLSASLLGDADYLARFKAEARLLAELDIPEIVRLIAYQEEPGAGAAIVMELVHGISLDKLLARQGATSPESALFVLKESLLGLAAAHSLGVVHRDYKPGNVLVDATGRTKLGDFGVAVGAGKRAPTAGTPLYLSPEQWAGAPASPATDIYAATAVLYQCLTGRPPFSGSMSQLRRLHEQAPVPSKDVDEPLRPLIERGMAKNPAARADDAAVFLTELEATAVAAYGPDWEWEGRAHLAARASALMTLLPEPARGPRAINAVTWFVKTQFRRRKRAVIAAAAVLVAAGVAIVGTAMAFHGQAGHGAGAGNGGTVIARSANTDSVFAAVTAIPPATMGSCAEPTVFKYEATLTASQPGPVTYRWVYPPATSAGQKTGSARLGPRETMQFIAAGTRLVSGGEVKPTTAGTGWAEVEVLSPVKETSNRAAYRLLCKVARQGHVTPAVTAAVVPKAARVTCGSTPPSFTFAGSVASPKAGPVTYYWALGDGATTTPVTLHFKAAGTLSVQPLVFTPPTDSAIGNAVIVVTSPDAAVSDTAAFTLSCHGHTGGGGTGTGTGTGTGGTGTGGIGTGGTGSGGAAHLSVSASARVNPASSTVGCAFGPATFTLTGKVTVNQATTVTYYWALSSGPGPLQTLTFAGAGTQSVTPDSFKPPTDSYAGAGEIIIASPVTSPPTPPSNRVTFTQSCTTAGLHVTSSSLPSATQNAAYSAALGAAGGKAPYAWSAGGLPAGLTMSSTGVISGTTSAPPGNYGVTVSVADSEAGTAKQQASVSLSLTLVAPTFPALQVTTTSLAGGTQGEAYGPAGGVTATATGGNGNDTWSATGLPDGLTISTSGVISGTPANAGTYSVVLTVADGGVNPSASSPPLTLDVGFPALQVTTTSLAGGTEGVAYGSAGGVTAAAAGGSGDYAWSAAGLPDGLTMSASGVISGTPTKAGSYSVVLTVADGGVNPSASSPALSLNVGFPALHITTTSLPATAQAAKYSATLDAAGGDGNYTWTVAGLPADLSINASTGVISGVEAEPGTFTVTVTVTDGEPSPQTQASSGQFKLVSYPSLDVTTMTLPPGVAGLPYTSFTLAATGGDGGFAWSATGLPAGLTMSTSGVISGTPETAGSYSVTVSLTDKNSAQIASATLLLDIAPPVQPISTAPS